MLTVEGFGHRTIGVATCANSAIATYLSDLTAVDGSTCEQDFTLFENPNANVASTRRATA